MELRAWRIEAGVVLVGRHSGSVAEASLKNKALYMCVRSEALNSKVGSGRKGNKEMLVVMFCKVEVEVRYDVRAIMSHEVGY